jgi:anti-sigma-K factor RskA/putative zinc finger protein
VTGAAHIPQEDLALYALQALSEDEAALVRAHLEGCAVCRNEVAELSGDLALVALSVEEHPLPEGAHERLMAKIFADAKADGREAAKEEGRDVAKTVVSIADAKPARPVYSSIQWAAVAAVLVFAFALMMKIGDMHRELQQKSEQLAQQAAASARAQRVLDVLTANSAQRVLLTAAKTKPAPSARAVYLASSGDLVFQANNLDPLPPGKAYELWVIPANGKAPIPAGLFHPDATGSASVILPPLPAGVPAKAFGVTVERAEGSDTPTAPILLAGAAAGE